MKCKDYTQVVLVSTKSDEIIELKIDFINDIPVSFGEIIFDDKFGKVDSIRNILSNKITALYRLEPKDIADIWIISKNMSFDWDSIINESKEKEVGLDVLRISEIITTFFPEDRIVQEFDSAPLHVNEFHFLISCSTIIHLLASGL